MPRKLIAGAIAAGLVMVGAAFAQERPTQIPERGNGVMSQFAGAGGDPALGARLYAERCASCHDKPEGRTPPKTVLEAQSATAITAALYEGVMRPMAAGLSPHDMASLAAHLSKAPAGGRDDRLAEAPACQGRPQPLSLGARSQWNGWGGSGAQARFQPDPGFAAADAPRLKLKWAFAYPGSRNGQATVVGDRLFINSNAGGVYALDARTGCAWWRFSLPGGSRSSIVVGRLPGATPRHAAYFTGWVERTAYALDAETGALIWKTQVDHQREVQMTGSPVLHGGRLYVTVSSAEEAIATDPKYGCCRFRGAVVALDAATGRQLWKTYMAGEARPFRKNAAGTQMYGPAGAAIWSAPTIDAKRGVLYVATGDSYTDVELPTADSIVALDLKTGAVRWKNQLTREDNYIVGCARGAARGNCPETLGPDHDFGASPILYTLASGKRVLLAGQKSSQVYGLDPDAQGKVLWEKRLSAGGPLGGIEFGMAADGDRLYAAVADIFTSGKSAAGLHAFNPADGAILWQAPTPRLPCAWKNVFCSPAMSQAVSAMPGLVFGGSMDGRFRAFDSATGKIVWEVDTAAQPVVTVSGREARGGVIDGAGPTIAGGMVHVTSGYQARSGAPGLVLMAFSVDGR
jgi:polyvinyl alcohol dehydrogenase (cytochrome)